MHDKVGGGGGDIGSFMATVHKKLPCNSNMNVQFMSNILETYSVSIIRACNTLHGCRLHLYP